MGARNGRRRRISDGVSGTAFETSFMGRDHKPIFTTANEKARPLARAGHQLRHLFLNWGQTPFARKWGLTPLLRGRRRSGGLGGSGRRIFLERIDGLDGAIVVVL